MAAHFHRCLPVVNSVFRGEVDMLGYTETHTVIKMHLPPLRPLFPVANFCLLPLFNANGPRRSSVILRKKECCAAQWGGGRGGGQPSAAREVGLNFDPWTSSRLSVADWGGVHSCLMTQRKTLWGLSSLSRGGEDGTLLNTTLSRKLWQLSEVFV